MPENEDELTRNDDKAARNTLGRRTFLGGVTLVAAAAVAGTTPALAHASKRLHSTSGTCLLYTSPSPRDVEESRMPSSA